MKLGLGLYRHMLTPENFRFARQAGATHIVAHLTDYFASGPRIPQSESDGRGWGAAGTRALSGRWRADGAARSSRGRRTRARGARELRPVATGTMCCSMARDATSRSRHETAHSRHGRRRHPGHGLQLQHRRRVGARRRPVGARRRGIGRIPRTPTARRETPIPNGQVWNMVYDPDARRASIRRSRPNNSGTAWT